MSDELLKPALVWRKTLLSIIAVTIVLAMVRLGFWQLDRAEQKQVIINQLESRAEQAATPIEQLFAVKNDDDLRFRKVSFNGRYLTNRDFFVDNQVVNGQVGYQVFTPFRVNASDQLLLVAISSFEWFGLAIFTDIRRCGRFTSEVISISGRIGAR